MDDVGVANVYLKDKLLGSVKIYSEKEEIKEEHKDNFLVRFFRWLFRW